MNRPLRRSSLAAVTITHIKNHILAALMACSAACGTLDDIAIPQPGDTGWQPEPFPKTPGAWDPCNPGECLVEQLGCHIPPAPMGEFYGGACTWGCETDEDCADLAVEVQAAPRCVQSVCELRCHDFDEECPEGMTCSPTTGEARICVWPGEEQV